MSMDRKNEHGHALISTDAYSGLGFELQSISFSYTSTGGGATDTESELVVGLSPTGGYRLYKVFLGIDPGAGAVYAADKLDFQIYDTDGVVGPPNTAIAKPVDNRYLWAGMMHEYTPDPADLILDGLYLRTKYVSHAASPAVKYTVEVVRRKV